LILQISFSDLQRINRLFNPVEFNGNASKLRVYIDETINQYFMEMRQV